ncbi:H-NS family nucleoid-associated regulatory protein, partial [Burkholderia ubonensis]|uniref:H-NS family nucleoid-associated regulatory protein n=1 Tax=Burkholderia ubonensis TaxID=101571 RepID=UPI000A90C1F2
RRTAKRQPMNVKALALSLPPEAFQFSAKQAGARYWNPHTGATWSGRGRRPKWLEEGGHRTIN